MSDSNYASSKKRRALRDSLRSVCPMLSWHDADAKNLLHYLETQGYVLVKKSDVK